MNPSPSRFSAETPSPQKKEKSVAIKPAIYLDYGLDGACLDDTACEVCERGMRFRSRWQFDLHTLLHIAFTIEENGQSHRIEVEGFVIETAPAEEGGYQTVLAFVEKPKELRHHLGKVSARLILPDAKGNNGKA